MNELAESSATAPGATSQDKSVTIQQTNQNNVNITTTGDAKEIADATGGAVGEQNRAALEGIKRVAPK
jgi:hypothetical protein